MLKKFNKLNNSYLDSYYIYTYYSMSIDTIEIQIYCQMEIYENMWMLYLMGYKVLLYIYIRESIARHIISYVTVLKVTVRTYIIFK